MHDEETDKASAAMDVNVGNFSDPEELPGLAHCVEHMLFMGTKKVWTDFPLLYLHVLANYGAWLEEFVSAILFYLCGHISEIFFSFAYLQIAHALLPHQYIYADLHFNSTR